MSALLLAVLLLAGEPTPTKVADWAGKAGSSTWGLAFTPNGSRVLAGSPDGVVTVRDTATGKVVSTWKEDAAAITWAFTKDGRMVAVGDAHQGLSVREVSTGKSITWWAGRECQVVALRFSSDASKVLLGCKDGGVFIGDLAKRKRLPNASPNIEAVMATLVESRPQNDREFDIAIDFSPDRTIAALGKPDGSLVFWNVPARKRSSSGRDLAAKDEAFTAVRFAPDGKKLILGGSAGTITVLDLTYESDTVSWANGTGADKEVRGLAVSPKGNMLLTGDATGTLHLWDLTGKELTSWKAHPDWVMTVAFSPDGTKAVSGGFGDSHVYVWDLSPWTKTESKP